MIRPIPTELFGFLFKNLSSSYATQAQAAERLQTGKRINRAADDPGRMVQLGRLEAQIRGSHQASRNLSEGVAMVRTAQLAVGQIETHLEALRELRLSAEATEAEHQAFQTEVESRLEQIQGILQESSYGRLSLLDGSLSGLRFQAGANAQEGLSLSLGTNLAVEMRLSEPLHYFTDAPPGSDADGVYTGTAVDGEAFDGSVTLHFADGVSAAVGVSVAGEAPGQTADSAWAKAAALNAATDNDFSASARTETALNFQTITGEAVDYSLDINGVAIFDAFALAAGEALSGATVAQRINQTSDHSGVTAAWLPDSQTLTLTSPEGRNITVEERVEPRDDPADAGHIEHGNGNGNGNGNGHDTELGNGHAHDEPVAPVFAGGFTQISDGFSAPAAALTVRGQLTLQSPVDFTFSGAFEGGGFSTPRPSGSPVTEAPDGADLTATLLDWAEQALGVTGSFRTQLEAADTRLTFRKTYVDSYAEVLQDHEALISGAQLDQEYARYLDAGARIELNQELIRYAQRQYQSVLELL